MSVPNGWPPHYKEMYEGWKKDLRESGWGEKFARARRDGITEELIREYQFEYARELIISLQKEDRREIDDAMEFVTYMVKTYVQDTDVERLIREGINSPGAWAYLTGCYFE